MDKCVRRCDWYPGGAALIDVARVVQRLKVGRCMGHALALLMLGGARRLNLPLPQGVRDQLRAAGDAQLAKKTEQVVLDGVLTEA